MTTVQQRQDRKVINGDLVVILYRLEDLGQGPYFAVTFDQYDRRGKLESCGAGVEQYSDHFPRIAKYAKWHLVNVKTGPMHYLANAVYHAGHSPKFPQSVYPGEKYPANEQYLHSTICYGALPDDVTVDPMTLTEDQLKEWLISRLGSLMAAFDADMIELFDL